MPSVALFTAEAQLADDVRRLCAAARVELSRSTEFDPARWREADLVVVDPAAAREAIAAGARSRGGICVVATSTDDPEPWRLAHRLDAQAVFELPGDQRVLLDALIDAGTGSRPSAPVVAVLSAVGGGGASTVAAALALSWSAAGTEVALVDGDVRGGGLDVLLGVEDRPGGRWSDLAHVRGRVAPDDLATALVQIGRVRLLSAGRVEGSAPSAEAAAAVLNALRGSSQVVLADLPRFASPLAAVLGGEAGTAFVVVPATVRAVAATRSLLAATPLRGDDVRLVVRRCPPHRLRPAEVATALGLPLAATVRDDDRLAAAIERGRLVPAFSGSRLAADLAAIALDGVAGQDAA